jgi:hypothetical protein
VSQAVLLLDKIGIFTGFAGLVAWMAAYTWQENWWRHQLGFSLVAKSAILAALLSLFGLSILFHLNRGDSRLVAWLAVAFLNLIGPVMAWRTVVWTRIYQSGPRAAARRARRAARRGRPVPVPGPREAGPFAFRAAGSKAEAMRSLMAGPAGGSAAIAAMAARDLLLDMLSAAPGAGPDGQPVRYEVTAAGDPGGSGAPPSLTVHLTASV